MQGSKILAILLLLFGAFSCLTAGNTALNVSDVPHDAGDALLIKWNLPAAYKDLTLAKADSAGIWQELNLSQEPVGEFTDTDLAPNQEYRYRLTAISSSDTVSFIKNGIPTEQWFYLKKLSFLIFLLVISFAILFYIWLAKQGKDLFIRRINGLDSMEEAIGRATEKGKPILFVPGLADLDDIQTIAALTILSHLARKSAEYDTDLIVPCRSSMVLSTAREIVKEAYQSANKADSYKEQSVFYLTDDQFGYVAGIDGIMVREQPAANFFLGTFWAESLILTETGFGTGAIQTAGTAQAHQLPFFIVSCDYTLIGEELFAASAYLSKDAQQLGSLKGHDFGKLLIILLILIGVVMEISGLHWFTNFFSPEL